MIGFQQDRTLLMSLGATAGISRGDRVENITAAPTINCTERMLGRVLDGFGQADRREAGASDGAVSAD